MGFARRLCQAGLPLLAALCAPAWAQYEQISQQWVDQALAQLPADAKGPLRMEVSVGALDSRLKLAPCAQVEPYLPPNTRLWGRTRLGLRCVDGATRWSVFLPITVKAFGPAWMLRGPVAQGAVLTADDAEQGEVDWAEDRSPVLADPALWVGQIATRSYMPGQAIRQSMVRAPLAFQAGAQVRVVAQGSGFSISSDGQALTVGVVGQAARVRMDNGRILTGTVLDARTVELSM
ncbi:flagellar basal body P-ring formation chaperone FlgA [Pseudorhodoferax sp. LjRoot39]|uniref:flagellar basal body P-ring formation chaperone FlgA n=1 Tax=Pseudorhodoferax sp. LjRoot39 TaxID=3342328 RepID=UPI003ECCFB3B